MEIREVKNIELNELLLLYTQLHNNTVENNDSELISIWSDIINDKNYHIIVAVENGEIITSCTLIIVRNLTHQQRPYGLIENVITDENHRGKGLATACLNYAKDIAIDNKCYKIMLMTGSKSDSTLNFYDRAGYNCKDKTAFIQWLNP